MSDDQVKIKKENHSDSDVCCSDDNYYPWVLIIQVKT